MIRKIVIATFIAIFVTSAAFAQKHSVTVDVGPTIVGLAIGAAGNMLDSGDESMTSSGFGIGLQYEHQILPIFSLAGRFAYLGGSLGYNDSTSSNYGVDIKINMQMDLSSFSLEGHGRLYPTAGSLFIDGMLGYGNLSVKTTGEYDGNNESASASRGYMKFGAKLGNRFVIGLGGRGFVIEPSFGYNIAAGTGKTLGERLSDDLGSDMTDMDAVFNILEKFVFIGGPRLSIALGFRL